MAWTKPRTSQDIPYVNKEVIEREVKGNLDYLKDAVDDNVTDIATNATGVATNVTGVATNVTAIAANAAKFDDCVMRDGTTVAYASPSGTRVKDGTYENTSGKTRFVSLYITGAASGDTAVVYVEDDATPAVVATGFVSTGSGHGGACFFVVPSGWYYKVYEENATITITHWVEWDIN